RVRRVVHVTDRRNAPAPRPLPDPAPPRAPRALPRQRPRPPPQHGAAFSRRMNNDTQQQASSVMAEILTEVERATAKFPTWPTDPLHAFAVVGEEFGEAQKEVLQLTYEPHKSSREELRKEAVQLAAMSLRFLLSF